MQTGRIIIIVLLAVALIFIIYERNIIHRSLKAFFAEKYLFKTVNKAPAGKSVEALNDFYSKTLEVNQRRVKPPEFLKEKEICDEDWAGMQVFSWNHRDSASQRVIIYIHGGAYINQPTPEHYKMMDKIAELTDASIVFPIYKLLPEYTYHAVYPEMLALYQDVLASVDSSDRITLMGDSAGGSIALGLAHLLAGEGIRQPKDIVLLSPWVDAATDNLDLKAFEKNDPLLDIWTLQQLASKWAGNVENLKDPLVSPIYSDRFSEMGRIALFSGTREVFYPDLLRLDKKLTQQGVKHIFSIGKGMNHVYPCFPIPEAKKAQQLIAGIIKQM